MSHPHSLSKVNSVGGSSLLVILNYLSKSENGSSQKFNSTKSASHKYLRCPYFYFICRDRPQWPHDRPHIRPHDQPQKRKSPKYAKLIFSKNPSILAARGFPKIWGSIWSSYATYFLFPSFFPATLPLILLWKTFSALFWICGKTCWSTASWWE